VVTASEAREVLLFEVKPKASPYDVLPPVGTSHSLKKMHNPCVSPIFGPHE